MTQAKHDPLAADDLVGADHRHRHDRRAGPQREAHGAGLGPLGPPVRIAGDPPFGKHADGLAGGEGVGRGIEGGGRVGAAAGDGNEPEAA